MLLLWRIKRTAASKAAEAVVVMMMVGMETMTSGMMLLAVMVVVVVVDGCCSLNDADDADGRQCKMPRVYDSVTGIMTAATTKKIITKRAVANAAAAASGQHELTSYDQRDLRRRYFL